MPGSPLTPETWETAPPDWECGAQGLACSLNSCSQ